MSARRPRFPAGGCAGWRMCRMCSLACLPILIVRIHIDAFWHVGDSPMRHLVSVHYLSITCSRDWNPLAGVSWGPEANLKGKPRQRGGRRRTCCTFAK
jgi:hypothetical protein